MDRSRRFLLMASNILLSEGRVPSRLFVASLMRSRFCVVCLFTFNELLADLCISLELSRLVEINCILLFMQTTMHNG